MPDRPPPDPSKLLEHWMEKGEMPPGRLIANLKTVEMLAVMLLPRQWLVPAGPPPVLMAGCAA